MGHMSAIMTASDFLTTVNHPPSGFHGLGDSGKHLYEVDPLTDNRWESLVEKDPNGSVFHSTAWLRALQSTYGYAPVVFTTCGPNESLENGLAFCAVESWLTGRRLVSLPFSDYCDFLGGEADTCDFVLEQLNVRTPKRPLRYFEVRPRSATTLPGCQFHQAAAYTVHRIDLRPDLGRLFANFHKSSIQRKILRAERERLTYVEGRTDALLDDFYSLLVSTRRRHRVPPQPKCWFAALMKTFGDDLKIRISLKDGQPIAAMLTIRHKDTLYYKYGGSSVRFNSLGGMHLLYWRAIQDGKELGLRVFDLGRSDLDQPGLITFKSRWGAATSNIAYWRIAPGGKITHLFEPNGPKWPASLARSVFRYMPNKLLPLLGDLLYRHVG
jgi:GNAT acetyltransferase-like protein